MSQEMTSQKIKRTCDACGVVVEWEMIGMQDATLTEMQNWYTVIREVWVEDRFTKIMTQACSLACVPGAAVKLALPKFAEQPADDIDLKSLRAANQPN